MLAGRQPGYDPEDFKHSFRVTETVPADEQEPRHRPIDTFHLLLDTCDPRYSCRNNVVIGPHNLVLYEDGIAFDEMSVRLRVLEQPRRVPGSIGYLSNADPGNYHHWFAFILPLMGTYRDRLGIDPDYYYVGRPLQPFHLETLARAGVNATRVLTDAVIGERLMVDSADRRRRAGAVDSGMLAFSRRLFYQAPGATPTRRLYVGRGSRGRRNLANEAQISDYAAQHGFEKLDMDGRSVAEQAQLFSQAAFIIAPHGAALTNLLFATPGARVLELLPSRPAPSQAIDAPALTVFREICAFVECHYYCLFGERVPSQRHRPQSDADFTIAFEDFRAQLTAMLSGANSAW